MQEFAILFVFAILIEAIVNITLSETKVWGWVKKVVCMILGITLCIVYKVGVISLLGIGGGIPVIDQALTGIAISRGSNYLSTFLTSVKLFNLKTIVTTPLPVTPTPVSEPTGTDVSITNTPEVPEEPII
jgi:hypothetical protein